MHFVSTTLYFTLLVYSSIQWENVRGLQAFEISCVCDWLLFVQALCNKQNANVNLQKEVTIYYPFSYRQKYFTTMIYMQKQKKEKKPSKRYKGRN